jgi:hypothetical protein
MDRLIGKFVLGLQQELFQLDTLAQLPTLELHLEVQIARLVFCL